ncbi:MAG: hypothetical protein IMX00_08325 [Limnochordales bacterium]|nr:hypothetical protein [Limnochordales bacterium]
MLTGIPTFELIVVLAFLIGYAFLALTGYRLEKQYWLARKASSTSSAAREGSRR